MKTFATETPPAMESHRLRGTTSRKVKPVRGDVDGGEHGYGRCKCDRVGHGVRILRGHYEPWDGPGVPPPADAAIINPNTRVDFADVVWLSGHPRALRRNRSLPPYRR